MTARMTHAEYLRRRALIVEMCENGMTAMQIAEKLEVTYITAYRHCKGVIARKKSRTWVTPEMTAEIRYWRGKGERLRVIAERIGKQVGRKVSIKTVYRHCYDVIPAIVRVENGKALGGRNRVGL
jgi:transposase